MGSCRALTIGLVMMLCLTMVDKGLTEQGDDPARSSKQAAYNDKDDPVTRMTDIHDIKPLETIGFDSGGLRLLGWGLLAFALAALMVAGMIRFRKHIKQKKTFSPPPPPHALALERLQALADFELMDCREFYFILSGIMRGYLQGRYGLDAPEMTTEELLPKILHLNLDRNLERGIKDFLIWSDPVKFAGIRADKDKMRADLKFAEHFIGCTTPEEKEPKTP